MTQGRSPSADSPTQFDTGGDDCQRNGIQCEAGLVEWVLY